MRRVWMALGALLAVASLVLVRAMLPDDVFAGVTVIGGSSTLPAGGGGASLDAGSVGASLLADGGIAEGHLSGALSASLVHYNDAGSITGYLTGTSAYTTVGYSDGGLTDGSTNLVAQGRIAFDPSGFSLSNDSDAGSTVVRPNTPTPGDRPIGVTEFRSGTQDWDYCFSADVTTTGASATVVHRIAFPAATSLLVSYACTAASPDGGATVSAVYQRRFMSTLPDGGSAPTTVGGIDTIGTDRENDTTWGGPNAITYDGGSSTGVAELVTQGAAGQTITWNCAGCWKRTPRADAGF